MHELPRSRCMPRRYISRVNRSLANAPKSTAHGLNVRSHSPICPIGCFCRAVLHRGLLHNFLRATRYVGVHERLNMNALLSRSRLTAGGGHASPNIVRMSSIGSSHTLSYPSTPPSLYSTAQVRPIFEGPNAELVCPVARKERGFRCRKRKRASESKGRKGRAPLALGFNAHWNTLF